MSEKFSYTEVSMMDPHEIRMASVALEEYRKLEDKEAQKKK